MLKNKTKQKLPLGDDREILQETFRYVAPCLLKFQRLKGNTFFQRELAEVCPGPLPAWNMDHPCFLYSSGMRVPF